MEKAARADGLKQRLYIRQHTFSQIFFAVHRYGLSACMGTKARSIIANTAASVMEGCVRMTMAA